MTSRIEELRAKLRGKPFDAGFAEFNSSVEDVLGPTRSASARSTPFMHALYTAFLKERPVDVRGWLDARLDGLFLSAGAKPAWVDEPSWCFHEDRPMTFMHQFTDEDGTTFYVFKTRVPVEGGWRALYKMIAQDAEGHINLQGDIRG